MKKIILVFIFSIFFLPLPAEAKSLAERLAGRIILNVEENGEAWYLYPEDNKRYFLGRPADAFEIMRELGLGIAERDFQKIPQAGMPVESDSGIAERLAGRIVIRVDKDGEAWYIDPVELKKHFLGRPADAFGVMRELGLGITRLDLAHIHKAGYDESINEYSRYKYKEKVPIKYEDIWIDYVEVDLSDPNLEIITDTADEDDCKSNCRAESLGEYVIDNNGFAGINGSYFDTNWSRSNYYFAPVYNSELEKLINEGQLKYWTTGPMVIFDNDNKFYYFKDSREFEGVSAFEEKYDTEIQAAISNRPRMVDEGKNRLIDWELDDKQKNTRSLRNALGYKEGKIYLIVARNATVPQLAEAVKVMGMEYALNLDGGYSSALFYNDEYMIGPGRDIPNAIVFKSKK
ncbi:MAG: phosphodiester glycosidase family protein [Patescibacteria group bacterium]